MEVDDSHQIINLPSTLKKRPRLKKKNLISFEDRCCYVKQIPQRVFPKKFVRGAKNSHWLVQSRRSFNGYMSTFNEVRDILPPSFFIKIKSLGFDQFLKSVDLPSRRFGGSTYR